MTGREGQRSGRTARGASSRGGRCFGDRHAVRSEPTADVYLLRSQQARRCVQQRARSPREYGELQEPAALELRLLGLQ